MLALIATLADEGGGGGGGEVLANLCLLLLLLLLLFELEFEARRAALSSSPGDDCWGVG